MAITYTCFITQIYATLTSSVRISQLFTNNRSIRTTPVVITHCPPLIIDAHLHSTLILIGASHQTNISIGTVATGIDFTGVHCNEQVFDYIYRFPTLQTYLDIWLQHHQCEQHRHSSGPKARIQIVYRWRMYSSWVYFLSQCMWFCELVLYQHQSEHYQRLLHLFEEDEVIIKFVRYTATFL